MVDFGQVRKVNESEKAAEFDLPRGDGSSRFVWIPKSCFTYGKVGNYDKVLMVKKWFCAMNRVWPCKESAF